MNINPYQNNFKISMLQMIRTFIIYFAADCKRKAAWNDITQLENNNDSNSSIAPCCDWVWTTVTYSYRAEALEQNGLLFIIAWYWKFYLKFNAIWYLFSGKYRTHIWCQYQIGTARLETSRKFTFFSFLWFAGKVFVHCAVGVSRSASLVLAYLMIHQRYPLISSVRCVQQKRWIFPNRGFMQQLIALDRELQDVRNTANTK